jgi:putative ABC transport system permease protein
MDSLLQDVRYAARTLWQNPGFALVAVIALALGIGANSTVYSSLRPMVLRPLPFHDLDRIVTIGETLPREKRSGISMAPANYRDLVERNRVFQQVAALRGRGWDANLTGVGSPERLEGYEITPSMFPLFGMAPLMGRTFTEDEGRSSAARVVVLGYAAWQRQLAADPNVVGRTVMLNGAQTTVIGVMPKEFDFPIGAQIWAPMRMDAPEMNSRGDHQLDVFARLKPGVSVEQARADVERIAANLERQYPETNRGYGFGIGDLREEITGNTRQFIIVLMWAATFVLLLACANVANLQLARALGRQKEFTIRAALGASRWRLARQVLVESMMLASAGSLLGLGFSVWAIDVTRSFVPPFIVQHIAGVKNIRLDASAVAFTALVAGLTGIVAGLIPALHVGTALNLNDALKSGTRGGSGTTVRHRLRTLLVVSEVALALVLLVGAGMMVSAFRNLLNRYPGFESQAVLSFRVTLPERKYAEGRQRADFYDRTVVALGALPGVESAGAVKFLPSGWSWQTSTFVIENQPARPDESRRAGVQPVTPDFFQTLRIPLHSGRLLTRQDGADTPMVAVISEAMAQRYWPGGDAIGHRIKFGKEDPWRTIVGIAGDIRQDEFDNTYRRIAYVPIAQEPPPSAGFVIRTSRDPLSMAAAARTAVAAVDPDQPVYDIRSLHQLIADNVSGVQYSANMMLSFAIIALVLAAAGIYAVMAYAVTQRTHEIGVRMALGAKQFDVLRMIMRGAVVMGGLGLAIGIPAALALGRVLSSVLFGVVHLQVTVFMGVSAVLALVALAAGYIPANRATRVDPMVALRDE